MLDNSWLQLNKQHIVNLSVQGKSSECYIFSYTTLKIIAKESNLNTRPVNWSNANG